MKRLELIKEIRSTLDQELIARLSRVEKELTHLYLKKSMRRLKNPMKIRELRKEIAIIKTIQTENTQREING